MADPRADSQYLSDNNELNQNYGLLNHPEYVHDSYTPMLHSSLGPLHYGNDINYNNTNESISNATIFPLDTTHNSLAENGFEDFLAEEQSSSIWTGHDFLQPLPSEYLSQLYQLDQSNSPLLATSTLYQNRHNRESVSTPPALPAQTKRGLPRRKSRYMMQNIDQRSNAICIPPTIVSGPADPLERWKESPPEAEAASLSAIQNALQNPSTYSGRNLRHSPLDPSVDDLFRKHRRPLSRAASTTSGESATSASSRRSNRSGLSVLSNGSQTTSDKTSAGVRKNQASTGRQKRSSANNPRMFCCTFCCDKFKSKYDWARHEKSLHLNLESWTCAPFGGSVILPSTGRTHCAYCYQLDPTPGHLEQHNHGNCQQQIRSFRRKDHLFQHLRHFHHLDTMPLIEDWKNAFTEFPSRCGFCDARMATWTERADHLTAHFRKGYTMAQWKGDHEFPPEIAAQVRYSVPPYLLDFESRTFVPFSATNGAVNDHLSQMLSRASFLHAAGESHSLPQSPEVELQPVPEPQLESYTDVLTRHLSHYAQQMMGNGINPTDEMFQLEARRLLFDSEDQWNQTMADNHEWLAKFRGEQGSHGPLQTPDQASRNQ